MPKGGLLGQPGSYGRLQGGLLGKPGPHINSSTAAAMQLLAAGGLPGGLSDALDPRRAGLLGKDRRDLLGPDPSGGRLSRRNADPMAEAERKAQQEKLYSLDLERVLAGLLQFPTLSMPWLDSYLCLF